LKDDLNQSTNVDDAGIKQGVLATYRGFAASPVAFWLSPPSRRALSLNIAIRGAVPASTCQHAFRQLSLAGENEMKNLNAQMRPMQSSAYSNVFNTVTQKRCRRISNKIVHLGQVTKDMTLHMPNAIARRS
jgi:hypothetical protein